MMSIATILLVQALLLNSQLATENTVKTLEVIPTPQPNTFEALNKDELQSILNDFEQEQALQKQIEQDMLKLAEEQARKENMTRVYYVSSDISKPSYLTVDELEKGFAGTNMEGLGQYFVNAEKEYGINAAFLASIGALESGWGESNYAKNRNNLFGFGAYDNNPDNAKYFSTPEEGILAVAKHLAENYIQEGGKYYNGSTPSGVNKNYCTQSDWSTKVVQIMNRLLEKALN